MHLIVQSCGSIYTPGTCEGFRGYQYVRLGGQLGVFLIRVLPTYRALRGWLSSTHLGVTTREMRLPFPL